MANLNQTNVIEYGVYSTPLSVKLEEKNGAKVVVAALNNADTIGATLSILEKDAKKVFGGMKLVKEALGASSMVLQLPKNREDLQGKLAKEASKYGIEILLGIVNVRANANNFVSHIVSYADLYDEANGKLEDGILVSVDGAEMKRYSKGTKISSLISSDVKGVETGYILRGIEALDMTLEEANIQNGVLNSITKDTCIVQDVDKTLMACREQSCGKCVFCREGLLQLEAMQKDITEGRGKLDELDMTKEIGEAMTYSTPCSMGQISALKPLSAISTFKDEYSDHIKKHKCAANACKAFQKVYVDPTACIGCAKCMPSCPVDAIDGAEGYIHIVFNNGCIKCGKCVDVCPEKAIHITTGSVPKLPYKMMRVGRFR